MAKITDEQIEEALIDQGDLIDCPFNDSSCAHCIKGEFCATTKDDDCTHYDTDFTEE